MPRAGGEARWVGIEKRFSVPYEGRGMIVSGSASQSLAAAVATETGRELAPVTYDRFPDGELLVTAPGADGRVVIIAGTPTSESHIELLQLQDAVREAGVTDVSTVIPYMGYARQDVAFEDGQPVSARAVARAISTGTDQVVVVNPHTQTVSEYFDVPTRILDAAGRLAEPLPTDLDDPLFLGPDENAQSLARTVRDAYGNGGIDYFEKTRVSGTEVEIAPSDAGVTGRDVVVVDDIIATGGTMAESIQVLNERDAARVFAACVHPVLAKNARLRLANAGVSTVFGTDTVERVESAVSIAPVIADALD